MIYGILVDAGERPDIMTEDGRLLGGLHCGDCFCILEGEHWHSARLEYMGGWYIIEDGKAMAPPYGSRARI